MSKRIAAFLFALAVTEVGAAQPQPPPLLKIVSLEPAAPSVCMITLENQYHTPAIAWTLTDATGVRYGSDVLLVPEVTIQPGGSQKMTYGCEGASTPDVTVVAVQYSDGSIAGSQLVFETSTQAPRRAQVEGFTTLSTLIASAQPSTIDTPDVRKELEQLIARAAGPNVSPMVKLLAANSLARVGTRLPAAASYVTARAALVAELNQNVALLRKFGA